MDTRTARRTAEKAARDLITSRAALVGDLAAVHTDHTRLEADISQAHTRGQQLIASAEAEAAQLVAAAQQLARDAEQRFADAYTAATTAGWTPADLAALGFQPTRTTGQRRPERQTRTPAAPTTIDPAPQHEPVSP